MEWDTAAGDAVLRAAGGAVLDPSGRPLVYGKAESALRNGPFIAWGDAAAVEGISDIKILAREFAAREPSLQRGAARAD